MILVYMSTFYAYLIVLALMSKNMSMSNGPIVLVSTIIHFIFTHDFQKLLLLFYGQPAKVIKCEYVVLL